MITLAEPFKSLVVPFAGLAEAYVVKTLRDAGLSMQRIRPAVLALKKEIGTQDALLSGRLKTGGVELLYEYLDNPDSAPHSRSSLAVVRDKQRVFRDVVQEHLQTVTYSSEDMISSFYPAKFGGADVIDDSGVDEAVSRRVFATRPSRRIRALRAQNFSPRSLIWRALCGGRLSAQPQPS
ncbi:hypothetical protein [Paramicrobacterium fandaimingii]|uniref:hypothetical protein n=1 Tax=Paramicrobacterium fandaimingii TaxID=2708079 RepID=UPI00142468FC|nr:hypothetical protein [Microbacterium fandaimingii]